MSYNNKIRLLIFVSISVIVAISFKERVAQDNSYHLFADANAIMNIPNFWNVLSNLPFLIFGGLGISLLLQNPRNNLWYINLFFFIGIFFTGFGSAYYHWNPSNETLVWDRLPMVITFMSFFSLVIAEYINEKWGRFFLFPMLLIGITSVFYWYFSELEGVGDLRFYGMVQFLPLILMPFTLLFFKRKEGFTSTYWKIIGVYIIAKIFETYDTAIYSQLHFISGHSLKHLAASVVPFLYWQMLLKNELAPK